MVNQFSMVLTETSRTNQQYETLQAWELENKFFHKEAFV